MKRSKTYPGYTNFYTYTPGEKVILMERTRNAQGSGGDLVYRQRGGDVVHRQRIEFDTPGQARRYFETQCGA